MPSPKDIKKLMNAAKGAKSASKPDFEALMANLPKGSPKDQLEAQLMFERLQAEKDAFYAPKAEDKTKGKAALQEIKGQLRESGKQRFLEPSAEKRRMYHGTRHYKPGVVTFDPENRPTGEGIREFQQGRQGLTFVSPDVSFANTYAGDAKDDVFKSGAVYPVHVQVRNPFDFENADHLDLMVDELEKLMGGSPNTPSFIHSGPDKIRAALRRGTWDIIESPPVLEAAKRLGFDGMYMNEQGVKNLGVFDPKRIKSAIGNQGTYDIENPDITKAEGGLALAGGGGKLLKALKGSASKSTKAAKAAGKLELPEAPLTLAERQLIAEKAPHLLIPGKLANVEKAIRESKGEFGAKRVQRAADEIKGLEDQYTEEALREAFGGDNATALMIGNPAEFQEYASRLDAPYRPAVEQYWYRMEPDAGRGAEDVPYLMLNKEEGRLPFVAGHEGRHRNIAATELGYPSTLWRMLPRAALREPFPRRSQEEYLEALINELGSDTPLVIPEGRFFPRLEETDELKRDWTKALQLPKLFAEGGQAMAKGGIPKILKAARGAEKAVEEGKDLQSMVEAARPLTAAERAMAGKLMTEYTANQPVTKLSEALGNVGAEGKKLRVTQADRTAARYLGGPPFSGLQLVDPNYAAARATWGVKTPGAAKNIANQSDADILWSTLIGSPFQHKSNEIVFDKLYKAFQKEAKAGNLNEELRAKFNKALEPHFGEGADILDPKLRKEIDTFEKRAVVADLLMGEKLGGALRGGSIIPGGRIMMETAEPMLRDVETFSIGPRLFTLDRGVISRPDLHPAFPEILQGEDLAQLFTPVPNEIALPTFNEEFRRRTGRKKPGYYDLTMTPSGEPYPTQEITDKYLRHLQREGFAEGGEVHMQGGGNPGEVSGEMFKPKPLEIPSIFKDAAAALKAQFEKERRSMRKPGAVQDVIMRGPVAFGMGAPMDIVGMGGELLDYAQTKIPALRQPASVMDTGPEKKPTMGFAPRVSLAPEGPYGTEAAQELLGKAGLTTGEERPLFELGAGVVSPAVVTGGYKAGKALAPTAREMLEAGLERAVEPTRMYAAPSGKPGKVKAPANPVGFYNPAEKAALNLQRKQGPGSAFISDMKKLEQGVNDERIAELGLDQLASKPNVTRDEVVALAEQNRIPLRESVRRPYQESDEYSETADALKESIRYREGGIQQVQAELDRVRQSAPTSPLVQQYESKIEAMRQSIARDMERLESKKPSLFGPDSHPDYNMPGGENYREIRVSLPETTSTHYIAQNKYGATSEPFKTEAEAREFAGEGGRVLPQKGEGLNPDVFYHREHHGNEPNVLFHLRVADHVDEEGKRGLLIDELQSDWHQQGREKGYAKERDLAYQPSPEGYEPHPYNGKPGFNFIDRSSGDMYTGYGNTIEEAKADLKKSLGKRPGVPDAPFKDNWYQLGLKRAIKEAADTGMDRVYLTTGALQNRRYDLGKHIDRISLFPNEFPNKTTRPYYFVAYDKTGRRVMDDTVTPEKLQEYIGKDASQKLLNIDPDKEGVRYLTGADLSIGGEGMRQYYDKTYKNFLEKYAKQHGGKLGMTKLEIGGEQNNWPAFRDWFAAKYPPGSARGGSGTALYQWEEGANNRFVKEFTKGLEKNYEPVYYIDLTDAMRNSAKKGQSYKAGGAVTMAEGGAVDYESRFNEMLQKHLGMAEGGAVDYESRFNEMLQKHIGMAEGGSVDENPYNSDPDMSDGGLYVQAPAFAEGGAVKSIWTVN